MTPENAARILTPEEALREFVVMAIGSPPVVGVALGYTLARVAPEYAVAMFESDPECVADRDACMAMVEAWVDAHPIEVVVEGPA